MKEQILDLIDTTLLWGSDVAEMWSGTQYEKQIDLQQAQVIKAAEQENWDKAETLVYGLAQFLHEAEEEYDELN